MGDSPAERLKTAKVKTIKQDQLTAECWLVQMWGTSNCETCEAKGTSECGGQKILKTGRNEKGVKVGENGMEND